MKRLLSIAVVMAVLGISSPAVANVCSWDVVPASTLLFPFVTYDYDAGGSGQTTLIAITNVSSEAQIVHITLWTDFSIAVLNFNIVLTGYDVQTINIRDILRDGVVPNETTGANIWWDGTGLSNAGGTPFDDGPYSTFNALWGGALDGYFASSGLPDPMSTNLLDCDPAMWLSSPNNYTIDIPFTILDMTERYLRASETATTGYRDCTWAADEVFNEGTWFTNQEPRATFMYLTADVVAACNKDLPDGDAISYFGAASGVRTANVLIGDVIYLDPVNNFSEALNAVHLEADPGLVSTPAPLSGAPTSFYHRYHLGLSVSPREPLPTAWAFRYLYSEAAQADTWIRAWKGGTENRIVIDLDDTATGPGGTIGTSDPSALYANTCIPYTYYAWDEDENVNSVGPGFIPPWSGVEDPDPIPVPNLFPLETQEVPISEFFLVEDTNGNAFGWMMVVWPLSNYDGLNPGPIDYDAYQTWMGVKYAAFGRFTAGMEAAVVANYNCDETQVLPRLGIGF